MNRALNTDEVAEPNAFAVTAAIAAFTKGAPWLDALRAYIHENRRFLKEFLEQEIPAIRPVPANATYLAWLDCSSLSGGSIELSRLLRAETGLYLSDGAQYGSTGEDFLRMNIACPRETLKDGLLRLKKGTLFKGGIKTC